ncbi:MAG: hypothetical protein JO001_29330 [Alphaproteobacteria bacterium]|nr:hypothetical protein [Alphaproteobacteria bacterium]
MSYFDNPPGERILYQFTIRPDAHGHWVAAETHGLIEGVFFTYEQARRFALDEAEGDLTRIITETAPAPTAH